MITSGPGTVEVALLVGVVPQPVGDVVVPAAVGYLRDVVIGVSYRKYHTSSALPAP